MDKITDILDGTKTIGIAGHVKPDGDCIGVTMGLYLYLRDNFPEIETCVYLEEPSEIFDYIEDIDKVKKDAEHDKVYDLFIVMDVSQEDRIGVAGRLFKTAKRTVCIDHHETNTSFAGLDHIHPEIGSACEVLYELLRNDKIGHGCAEALYTGIVHDTGVFQYSNTRPDTLRIAARLMEKGVHFHEIIDGSFMEKTYVQNQILGKTLLESKLLLSGRCIVGVVNLKDMDFYGLHPSDLDGIVNQLNNTKEAKAALFLYETEKDTYKVSLRSKDNVDVCRVAKNFGGGGHKKAAGCTMKGSPDEIISLIAPELLKEFTNV